MATLSPPAPLLSYSLTTQPNPVQAGSSVSLTLLVSCPTPSVGVSLAQFNLLLPVGSASTDLLASIPTANVYSLTSSDGTSWLVDQTSNDDSTQLLFKCDPASGSPVLLKKQFLTLLLTGLTTNDVAGTATLTVKEWAATPPAAAPSPGTEDASGQLLLNVPLELAAPANFYIAYLEANPVAVAYGQSTTLSWSVSDPNTTTSPGLYQLTYNLGTTPVTVSGLSAASSEPATGLQDNPTIFTLQAKATSMDNWTETQFWVTVGPPPPVILSFVGVMQAGVDPTTGEPTTVLLLSWTTTGAVSCVISSIPNNDSIGVSGSFTLYAPFSPPYTLTATNILGEQAMQPLALGWGAPLAVPVGSMPAGLAFSPNGASLCVANSNLFLSGSLSVLDAQWLTPAAGTPLSFTDCPVAVAFSQDGAYVFVLSLDSNSDSGADNPTSKVYVYNTSTWTLLTTLATGAQGSQFGVTPANLITVAPDGSCVLVANPGDGTITPITYAASDSGSPTITLGTAVTVNAGLTSLVYSASSSTVFAANKVYQADNAPVSAAIMSLTAPNLVLGDTIAINDATCLLGLAISAQGNYLFVTGIDTSNYTTLWVLELTTGGTVLGNLVQTLQLIESGDTSNSSVAVLPDGSQILVSDFKSSTLFVIDGQSFDLVGQSIALGNAPSGLAVSPNGTQVFVSDDLANTVTLLSVPLATGAST